MTNTPTKVFREYDTTDYNGTRCDFFMQGGPLISSWDAYMTTLISVELMTLGYQIEDFPQRGKDD